MSKTMQVQISPKWRSFIEGQIARGNFASVDELVDTAVERMASVEAADRELCDRHSDPPLSAEDFRQMIQEGVIQAEAGQLVSADLEDIQRCGRERLAARGITPVPRPAPA